MTAPARIHEPIQAEWHRLSPRMLLVHPVIEVGRALPGLLGIFVAGHSQGHEFWGLAATGGVVLYSLTRWFTTRLRITPEHVQLRRGLLRRETVTTARDRIRTVDVTSHLLHRILGLARVVVGTGTNDRKGQGRIVLDGLTTEAAQRLRDDLLHRGPATRVTAPPTAGELVRFDRRWIRYAPFTLSGVVTGLVIWGFVWRLQSESQIDLVRRGPVHAMVEYLQRLPGTVEIALVVGGLIAFVAITSTVGYVLAFWNFRLLRHDGGTLQVSRGLVTTRATSIERRRLVGVTISEPLPLRAVHAARTTAVATGLRTGRGAERGGEVLLPPAPRAEAEQVAGLVLDASPAVTVPLLPHGAAARRRRVARALGGGVLLTLVTLIAWSLGAPSWPVWVALTVLALGLPIGLDRAAALGHQRFDGYLVTRGGSLLRRRTALDERAIIGWNLRSTFFQRRLGLVTLVATTAAGTQGYRIVDVPAAEALAIAEAISPSIVRPFRRKSG